MGTSMLEEMKKKSVKAITGRYLQPRTMAARFMYLRR